MKIIVAFAIVLIWPLVASSITVDTVVVGNPGNQAFRDINLFGTPGRVNYVYSIGKYETTVGQYTSFLNAVAATDTYGLYNTAMANDANIAGIARVGVPGSYAYSVIGSSDHPITYVSWGDAARFANWLSNGQPTGVQNSSTTEDGSYSLNGAVSDAALISIKRNASAKWVIPSDDEWFKAAYYERVSASTYRYWTYPVRTDGIPYSDQPPGATPGNSRVANFYNDDGIENGYNDGFAVTGSTDFSVAQNYLTDVGAYASSPSFYGTFDQGGNVLEWDEYASTTKTRGERGGAFSTTFLDMKNAEPIHLEHPSQEGPVVGFRVAIVAVPESSAIAYIGTLSVAVVTRRRRSTLHDCVKRGPSVLLDTLVVCSYDARMAANKSRLRFGYDRLSR